MTLEDIFYQSKHNSDKWRPYFKIYSHHLQKFILKNEPITLVEVGVQNGGSLEMWGNYLPKGSTIIGIDIDSTCAQLKYDNPNISVVIGDQSDPGFWHTFFNSIDSIDVFIDDGGHHMKQQIITLESVYPKINLGGVFICEDTHTSYWNGYGGGLKNNQSFIEYSKLLIDVLHNPYIGNDSFYENKKEYENLSKICQSTLTSVHFYDSVVVLEKNGKAKMERVFVR